MGTEATDRKLLEKTIPMFILWIKNFFNSPNHIMNKDYTKIFLKHGKMEDNKWAGSKSVESFIEDGTVVETVVFTFGFEIIRRPYFPMTEELKEWEETQKSLDPQSKEG